MIENNQEISNGMDAKLSVLILYDFHSTHINAVFDHLYSFGLYSSHNVFYAPATHEVESVDLEDYDYIIIHYCVRVCLTWHLSPSYREALKKYTGLKALFIQDEYDTTEQARKTIEELGITMVFTCVPSQYHDKVYPKARFPNVEFNQVLTGYVPLNYRTLQAYHHPLEERKNKIGYRGRNCPFYYGDLAREKSTIAKKMKEITQLRNIKTDIEYDCYKRIYGTDWYKFIANCWATLGTESGANIFDFFGDIRNDVENELKNDPNVPYETIHNKYLKQHEGQVKMNQISPRIFESIALKTALILFEGEYSGIVKPHVHYIPLKKDFSNIDEILKQLDDTKYINELIERSYKDIILSGHYDYKTFVQRCEQHLNAKLIPVKKRYLITTPLVKMQYSDKKITEDQIITTYATNIPLEAQQYCDLKKSYLITTPLIKIQNLNMNITYDQIITTNTTNISLEAQQYSELENHRDKQPKGKVIIDKFKGLIMRAWRAKRFIFHPIQFFYRVKAILILKYGTESD